MKSAGNARKRKLPSNRPNGAYWPWECQSSRPDGAAMYLEHRYWSAESLSRHTAGATNISQIGQRTSIKVACNCSTLPLPSHLLQRQPRPNLPSKWAKRPPPCHQSAVFCSLVILLPPLNESWKVTQSTHLLIFHPTLFILPTCSNSSLT